MKLTVCLSASLLALLACPAGVRADGPDPSANPYANLDPDGVPLAVTQGNDTSSQETDAQLQEQADAQAHARNWLLLDYQQQLLRNKAEGSANAQALNIYLQLSLNKDITQVLQQPSANPETVQPSPSFHATSTSSSTSGNRMNLRSDSTPASNLLAPLISPFSSAAALSASQPFNASAYASPLPPSLVPGSEYGMSAQNSDPVPAPKPTVSPLPTTPLDTVDMETPGMVADKSSPLPGTPDLNLDSLPDQNEPSQQPTDGPPQLPQLGQAADADQLHAQMNAKLSSPKMALKTADKPTPPPAPAQPPPPEVPMPISQQPMISPVHAPLPNPYDILNR